MLSAVTGIVLIGYAMLVAAALAIATRRRRSAGSIGLALILASTVLVVDAFLMTSRDFRPRGPLG